MTAPTADDVKDQTRVFCALLLTRGIIIFTSVKEVMSTFFASNSVIVVGSRNKYYIYYNKYYNVALLFNCLNNSKFDIRSKSESFKDRQVVSSDIFSTGNSIVTVTKKLRITKVNFKYNVKEFHN